MRRAGLRPRASHLSTTRVESIAVDDWLDIPSRGGEVDLFKKLALRYLRDTAAATPTLGATGSGIVLRQGKRNGVRLMLPVLHRTTQIPGTRFQIRFWLEKLVRIEARDLCFSRPFVGRPFAHLHQPTLSMRAALFWVEPAFTPDDCFHQHRIEMML